MPPNDALRLGGATCPIGERDRVEARSDSGRRLPGAGHVVRTNMVATLVFDVLPLACTACVPLLPEFEGMEAAHEKLPSPAAVALHKGTDAGRGGASPVS